MSARTTADEGALQLEADRRWRSTEQTLRLLRGNRRRAGSRLFWGYVAALVVAPLGWASVSVLRDLGPLPAPAALGLVGHASVVAPAALLALAALAVRFAAWHGVVVVSRADVDWLLTAPLPRRRVLGPVLVKLLAAAAALGGSAGLVTGAALGLAIGLPATAVAATAVAGVAGGAGVATLAAAAGWLVQCRPRWSGSVLRAAPAMIALTAVVAVAGWHGQTPAAAEKAVLWSGPWGWAAVPLLTIVEVQITGAGKRGTLVVSSVLLAAAVAAVVVTAFRRLRTVPLEELRRREATATRLLASAVYAVDVRGGSQARREAVSGLVSRRPTSRRAPRHPSLWAAWSSLLLLLRSRERLGHAAVWVAAAAAIAFTLWGGAWEAAAAPLAAAAAYLAASALIEPLRVEIEERFASSSSPWNLATVLRRQALASVAVLGLMGGAATAGATVAGAITPATALALVGAALAAAPVLIACAAVVAAGPPPDPAWLYLGDMGVAMLFAHLTQGAHLAAAVVGIPAAAALAALAAGAPAAVVGVGALLWAGAATAALDRWARRRLAGRH